MKLAAADWQKGPGMRRLVSALGGGDGDTRYVGGCVRDTLLGLQVNDVDLATRLPPDDVMRRLNEQGIKVIPTGIAHGTVTAILGGSPVEVTTLRRDVATDGRHATVAFTDDWREDAARRDFTMNALTADPGTGEIFDYFEGIADLDARRVRFIGDPLTRISEDHLRILRFFRFHARFGEGAPDGAALDACTARANDLMALSRERIADELLKLLGLPSPHGALALMVERGILKPVLPEIDQEGLSRLAALTPREAAAGIAPHPLRRLAALLPQNPDIASAVAARLRLSKKAMRRLVAAASRDKSDANNPQLLAYRIGLDEALDRILLGMNDLAAMNLLANWQRPRLLISGGDLIGLGLAAGPIVARTLQAIERDWAEAGFPAEGDAQRQIALRHVDQVLRARQ